MSHVQITFKLSRDGAPMRVMPVGNAAKQWLVLCKVCAWHTTLPNRAAALETAEAHTYLSEALGTCAAGRAVQKRRDHRLAFGHYLRAEDLRFRHTSKTRETSES